MSLYSLSQTYRSINRLREIALILSQHGFHQVLEAAGLSRFLPLSKRFRGRSGLREIPAPVQLRMALEDLGPTFMKLGQMLATRPDLVPLEFVEEFKKLQDQVPPFPTEQALQIIEAEVGAALGEVFQYVDPMPMAAASIAQVHRATLADGTPVALKVQRPGIERTVSKDLATLYMLVNILERYVPEARPFQPRGIVDEFARTIRRELDFFLEASNTERFRQNVAEGGEVVIPRVHWELSTRRLLVLDALDGVPADDPRVLSGERTDPTQLAQTVARAFLKQVFDDGLFHGDLHAGNMLSLAGGRLGLLDFGAVGYLSEELQETLSHLFVALIGRDYAELADGFLLLGSLDESVDMGSFQRDLRELIEPYHGRPLQDLRLGEILREATQIAIHHHVKVPTDLTLLVRSVISVEGLTRQLDPGFLVLDMAGPYARRLLARRLDPRRQARLAFRTLRDLREFTRSVPRQLTRLFQKMIEGKFAVDFVHQGYEPVIDEMDRSSNRISFSLIISALIIGSAVIVLAGRGPLLWGFPVFGILGFMLAGVLGFGLAFAILRSGKF
ncbi:MAG TPA: AarF/ABC1/UbiB kinase family protein [Deferrisomatales bacterium]|nr:AarF/ABC1/UbiB kinase family protein [Deferrisomatales bacterium]